MNQHSLRELQELLWEIRAAASTDSQRSYMEPLLQSVERIFLGSTIPNKAEFYGHYWRLSQKGYCDIPGGMECKRVYNEWIEAGRPRPILKFIRERASI